MKYLIQFIKILVAYSLLYPLSVFASGTTGTSGAAFLELPVGSRPLSMGDAFTAEVNDINAIYFNPAGLGSMKYPVLSINHQELIEDSRFENISMCYPLFQGYIGFSNSIFWVPPFEKIDIDGNKTGEVTFYNGCTTVAYGYDFEFIYIGGGLKYVYQRIDTLFVQSVAVDIGILKGMYLYSPFNAPLRNFHIGISMLNLGSGARDDPLPRMLRLGLSYKLTNWFGLNMDFTENMIDSSDLYDFTYGFDEGFRMNLGVEFTWLELLFLRGGYRFNDGGTYTFGIGFNYVIKNVTFNLDASYAETKVFGPTYSITLSFKLIPKVVTIEDKIEADKHYKNGIRYFVANDIDTAMKEFKLCRDFDPYYKSIDKKITDLEELHKLQTDNKDFEKEIQEIEKNKDKGEDTIDEELKKIQ